MNQIKNVFQEKVNTLHKEFLEALGNRSARLADLQFAMSMFSYSELHKVLPAATRIAKTYPGDDVEHRIVHELHSVVPDAARLLLDHPNATPEKLRHMRILTNGIAEINHLTVNWKVKDKVRLPGCYHKAIPTAAIPKAAEVFVDDIRKALLRLSPVEPAVIKQMTGCDLKIDAVNGADYAVIELMKTRIAFMVV